MSQYGSGFLFLSSLSLHFYIGSTLSESVAVVARLDDVAVMREPVEQRSGHLRIAEHGGPLREAQVRGDNHAGTLIELAQQVEQQRATGLGEWQVAEFVEDDEVNMDQAVGGQFRLASRFLDLELVDQVDGGEAAHAQVVLYDRLVSTDKII